MHPEVIAPGTNTVQANCVINALAYTLIKTPKPLHHLNKTAISCLHR